MAEKFPHTVFWGVLGAIMGCGFQLNSIADAIDRQTDIYLCVEAAKLNVAEGKCDKLLGREQQP